MRASNSLVILVMLASVIVPSRAADTPVVRASLRPQTDRKIAAWFELEADAGKRVKLSDFRGRVLLLNFWATWCGGCKLEIPCFQQFQTDLRHQGLSVLGVSIDETGWAAVKPYLKKARVTYRRAIADRLIPARYGVKSLPATYLIDRKSRIAAVNIGVVDRIDLETKLKAVLGEDGGK